MPNIDPSSKCTPAAGMVVASADIVHAASRFVRPTWDKGQPPCDGFSPEGGGRYRALIIDDERAVANVAKKGLELAGFTVDVAWTGADGTARIIQGGLDLVFLDWRLADMTGGEVLSPHYS